MVQAEVTEGPGQDLGAAGAFWLRQMLERGKEAWILGVAKRATFY